MRVSIAMATYNGSRYLQQQLDSFINQVRLPDELVVCDDMSSDTTIKILETFADRSPFDVRIYKNDKNIGHMRNFENVLSKCNGDVIFLSDQDDVWRQDKIQYVVNQFEQKEGVEVIINDAHYTDESLNLLGLTVLQKVNKVGSNKNGHISGACTAMTRRFRDAMLPFPEQYCPPHDVYIHRWANLMKNKVVVDLPLQKWRIHGNNASTADEMSYPAVESVRDRYRRSKESNASAAYRLKAREFQEMLFVLENKKNVFCSLSMCEGIEEIRAEINKIISAHIRRSQLISNGWFERKRIIFKLIVVGHYRYFKGIKSIVKDLLI